MHPQQRVTAVVVAHNGAEYLPDTLKALGQQTRPPDFHVGVDAGSSDESASLLQLQLPVGSPVVGASGRGGFGAAVRTGLAEIPSSRRSEPDSSDPASGVHDWIWLLHDDSAPEPTALEQLLRAVELAPSVTVAGAKQVEWEHRRKLVDVGLSISRWAERLTLIDVDELDQGQYDVRSDMFAVNSAGMLIRRDVWDKLGGFDPALPGTGDDVDFCWRNRLAGHRVVVAPGAVLRHAGSRDNHAATLGAARRAEVYLRLKHATLWKVPFLAVGAVLGGFARLILGLLAKDPGYGVGQLTASIAAVLKPFDLYRSRRSAARTRRLPRSVVRALRTDRREVWSHRKSVVEAFSARGLEDESYAQSTAVDVPSGDANDDFAALEGPSRIWAGWGAIAAAIVLLGVSLVALHRFIGAAALAGGSLLPLSTDLAEIWANGSRWWIDLGAGFAGHGDPFSYVLWLISVLGFGNGNVAVVVLMLCAAPLAGLSAWFGSGAFVRSRSLRLWAAFCWGSLPVLQVATGSGRLGALLVHLLLPLVALAFIRAVGQAPGRPGSQTNDAVDSSRRQRSLQLMLKPGINGVPSWTAAAAAGLMLAVVTASAPSLLLFFVLAVVLITLVARRRAKTLWWALLPPLALFIPFAASTLDRPWAVFGDPGLPLPFNAAPLWQQLLGYPVAFPSFGGLAAFPDLFEGPWPLVVSLIVGLPVLLLAATALFLPGKAKAAARVLWLLALLALLGSVASSLVVTGVGSSSLITPFTGPSVSIVSLALLAAALLGGEWLQQRLRAGRSGRSGRPVLGARAWLTAAALVLALGPATSLTVWLVPQLRTPDPAVEATTFGTGQAVVPSAPRTLPATAADRGTSGQRSTTLVMNVDGDSNVSAALMRGGGTTLDALSQIYSARQLHGSLLNAQLREDDDAAADVRRTVATLVAGTGVDPREELERLGVGFVVLQQSGSAAEVLASQIDSVPGLVSVGNTEAGWLWRVEMSASGNSAAEAQVGRVRIVDEAGSTLSVLDSGATTASGTVPAGPEGRMLVLNERSEPGWEATLNGERLEPASTGWNQAFALPAAGGDLEVHYVTAWEPWSGIAQAIVFSLTVLLAVPIPARPRFVHVPQGRNRTAAVPVSSGRRAAEPVASSAGSADAFGSAESAGPASASDPADLTDPPERESALSSGRAGS
ncbi:glycosyltransferase family 2 protein [Arthrobacter sp. EH-1B-1]|uniref:Glycosyltransferase family 2 protein n=1 Tax=Arthrobacter vasquezii TaxID=2977629 RepID=A0ABT6CZG5_9MICC|nr:glycosyltransferase family 2 protein [Arthrobacter vasquezii]MDF9278414.1 glycosyltransferase family 2 protein [Arthrobacter vasquezii]